LKPLILISNDDGIRARGIETLIAAVADLGELLVVAPDREQSAMSHAISLDRPLRVSEVGPGRFSVDGTPADCMYLACIHIAGRKPSLCISGINHGYNLGSDFFYSGTVAAAVEAAIRGVPAFAISLQRGPKTGFQVAADFARALSLAILGEGLPAKALLNVNVPNVEGKPVRGYQWTRLGERVYRDQVEVRQDLRGRRYFWIGGPELDVEDVPGSDVTAVRDGLVSVTPLDLDLTSHGLLDKLPGWRLEGFEAILHQEGHAEERRAKEPA
jgi:5'-nucleotidase